MLKTCEILIKSYIIVVSNIKNFCNEKKIAKAIEEYKKGNVKNKGNDK